MEPKTLFVKKNIVENSKFEAFKDEVNEKLSSQQSQISEIAQNQKIMETKQDDMSADLKAILAILSQK
ncbi:hypothetical protein A2U01_0062675 [Trifolium medium]|uniref:Uncharacterized protein n=1 Tax=Trifolium medium TaxID=97028 RepID=A0A392RZ75_9FABA|nr:hypothetical protein [Trifolium medium]